MKLRKLNIQKKDMKKFIEKEEKRTEKNRKESIEIHKKEFYKNLSNSFGIIEREGGTTNIAYVNLSHLHPLMHDEEMKKFVEEVKLEVEKSIEGTGFKILRCETDTKYERDPSWKPTLIIQLC